MVYIRIKRIKKKSGNAYEYAYLVENKWRKRPKGGKVGARQKVKAFLGRVYVFLEPKDIDFIENFKIDDLSRYVKEKTLKEIVKDLISLEFFKHGIDKNDFLVDFNEKIVRKYNNKAVLKINEGFLCDHTLRKLVNFRFKEDEHEAGMALAKAFVEAGIKIPEELFVKVFEKIS